ncbi:hypothetical protein ACFOWE_13595 [Planomonospora corallina]|uniref:Chromate transporter n=1 Tax=Planomonospora corallina TaxID=1806052 RepID=A0ABV8I8U0_9ACTN
MVGQDDALDFLAWDRRERAIMRHMVLSLAGGLLLGALGEVLAHGPEPLSAAFDPYAYLLFAVVVGHSAAGFGWAALGGTLAALGPVVAMLAATFFPAGRPSFYLGGDAMVPGITLLAVAVAALLAHLAGREGLPGDLAAGLPAGVLLVEVAEAARSGSWSVLVAAVAVLAAVLALRRGTGAVRAALVAVALGAAHVVIAASA